MWQIINHLRDYNIIEDNYVINKAKQSINCYNFNWKEYPCLYDYSRSLKNLKKTKLYEAIDIFDRKHSHYQKYIFANLKDVKIEKIFFTSLRGSFIQDRNGLELKYRDNSVSTFYHELLHLSSSYIYKNTWFCGLSQTNLKTNNTVGLGLDEGYTQLLTNRDCNSNKYFYFNKLGKLETITYEYNVCFARLLEIGLGKEFMEKCYFAGDLYNLKKKVLSLVGLDDTNKLFRGLDFFLEENYNDYEYVETLLEDLEKILLRICILNGGDFNLFQENRFVRSKFHEDKYIPQKIYNEYVELGLSKGEKYNER